MVGGNDRILLIDNVVARRHLLCARLSARGHTVLAEPSKHGVMRLAESFQPDAVVVELSDESPAAIVGKLRAARPVRVIFLAAPGSGSAARVAAARAGADAVLVEPFVVEELVAILETMMSWKARRGSVHRVHDLMIDEAAHEVTLGGAPLTLTVTEFRLLLAMVHNAGLVMSKRSLLEQVWGFGEYDPNVVEVHVSALRRKLLSSRPGDLIETVRGVGYVIRATNRSPVHGEPIYA